VWLCPDGGTAWDFHESRGDDAFAGGDPYLRRKDQASRVYVFVSSQTPYWLLSNIKSAPAHFKEETIFFGADSDIEGQLPKDWTKGRFCQKDADAIAERDKILRVLSEGRLLKHSVTLDVFFDIRFLAKLAIAFGHIRSLVMHMETCGTPTGFGVFYGLGAPCWTRRNISLGCEVTLVAFKTIRCNR
jgi:hypothetical protein